MKHEDNQMIANHIKRFREKQEILPELLKDLESSELRTLDAEMSRLLEEIFAHCPANVDEFRCLMEFFLDLLVLSDPGGDRRVISRIEELTTYTTNFCSPSMHGRRVVR